MFFRDEHNVYRVRAFRELPWLEHGFGTRLSDGWADSPRLTTLKQIHSGIALVADRAGCLGKGDALIADRPGAWLAVRTADCLPILLVDPVRRAVAAIHAGWRGTVAGVAQATVRGMQERFGTRTEDLMAAIGPGIGACCYEVGPEVAVHFGLSGGAKVDLAKANLGQLVTCGIPESLIFCASLCTACDPAQFHSHRRDRAMAGRMLSAIGITGQPDNRATGSRQPAQRHQRRELQLAPSIESRTTLR